MRAWVLALGAVLAVACAPPTPQLPELMNRDLYTCCTLWFDLGRNATDANYQYNTYREGTVLPLGTRVRVVSGDQHQVRFQPAGMEDTFRLVFRFGTERSTGPQWFHQILLDQDPRRALSGMSPAAVHAIQAGQLAVGLTKVQAIMARGYPPLHRTAGIDADEWLYYASPGFVDRVRFSDGAITSVQREPAPQ